VPFVRRVLKFSQTCERWSKLAWHATIVDRYSYRKAFYGRSQALYSRYLAHLFSFQLSKSLFQMIC
jgi:hypothetical protein